MLRSRRKMKYADRLGFVNSAEKSRNDRMRTTCEGASLRSDKNPCISMIKGSDIEAPNLGMGLV